MGFPRSNWSTLDRTDSPFLLPGSFLPPRRWFGLSRFQCGRLHYCTFSPISVVVLFYPPITIITSVGSVPPHPVLVIRCVSSAVRNYGKSSVIYLCLAFYCVSLTPVPHSSCVTPTATTPPLPIKFVPVHLSLFYRSAAQAVRRNMPTPSIASFNVFSEAPLRQPLLRSSAI